MDSAPTPEPLDLRALLVLPGGGWRRLAETLVARPDREAQVAELVRLAETDPEVDVRYKAKKTLGLLGSFPLVEAREPAAWLLSYGAGEAAGRNSDPVLEALGRRVRARDLAAADELSAYLPQLRDPVALCAGIGILALCGQVSAIPALKRFLAHESPRVVASAVEAMGKLDPDTALPLVLPVLLKDDNRVRANVLMVLYKISRTEVLAYLARMAGKFEESYRASALWCLNQLEDEDTEEILVSMLAREDSPELCEREAELLARVGTLRSVAALTRLGEAQEARGEVARRAVSAIGSRLGIAPEELARASRPVPVPSTGGLSGRIRRITRKVLSLGASSGRTALPATAEPSRASPWRAAAAAASLLLVAGLVWRGGRAEPPDANPSAGVARASVAPSRAPAPRPGGVVAFEGRVKSQTPGAVLVRHDYNTYAVSAPAGRTFAQVAAGERVRVTGTYAGWDTLHGVVRIDGRTLEPRR